jgi:hypothetical protein
MLLTREVGINRETYVNWLAATIEEHLARGRRRSSGR